jgi:hypothetical protein
MSETKGIKTEKGRATTSTANHGDLAELLAAVMAHPDTPGAVVNDIADTLCGLRDKDRLTDAEVIRRALRNAPREPGAGAGAGPPDLETLASTLTRDEVRGLCEDYAYRLGGRDEDDSADVLTLLTAFTFTREMTAREGFLLEARAAFMPFLRGPVDAVDALILKRLEVWRG